MVFNEILKVITFLLIVFDWIYHLLWVEIIIQILLIIISFKQYNILRNDNEDRYQKVKKTGYFILGSVCTISLVINLFRLFMN
ncbi:hypothetical protein, partial [Anaerorhabdus sp.]|uniref:hypothetical protein n=1 Tax=Anaerorhabdus sp. TaxID=1872524 RepID=UPI002FC711AD